MVSPKDKKSQADKFKEAARELETDDDEGRFNEHLKEIAKSPPKKINRRKTSPELAAERYLAFLKTNPGIPSPQPDTPHMCRE
jgi:hypothetical protein